MISSNEVTVGTPDVTLKLDFDTNFSDLWSGKFMMIRAIVFYFIDMTLSFKPLLYVLTVVLLKPSIIPINPEPMPRTVGRGPSPMVMASVPVVSWVPVLSS